MRCLDVNIKHSPIFLHFCLSLDDKAKAPRNSKKNGELIAIFVSLFVRVEMPF